MAPIASNPRNRLLAALSGDDLASLQPHLVSVPLKLRYDLEKPHKRIDDVYFPDEVGRDLRARIGAGASRNRAADRRARGATAGR